MPVGRQYYVTEGMVSRQLTNADTDNDGNYDHYYFSIWNQKLHAKQPLGNMRRFSLQVDGIEIPSNQIYFALRGQWICIEQLPTITDIWWMLREEARIYVKQKGGISPGTHRVRITIENQVLMYTRTVDRENLRPRVTLSLQCEMTAS